MAACNPCCGTPVVALGGGGVEPLTSVTITVADSPFLASESSQVIYADSTTGPITVLLPPAPVEGDDFIVKDSGGDAANNNVTVDGNGNTIDGAATSVIGANYGSLRVRWNGSEWSVL